MLAALVFNRLFFPSVDPLSGTLLAFSTFAVGYLSRPVGGIIFGHLGDRFGRRFVLVATLLLMGITTALMGMLPTYESVGVISPILLVLLRFIQGAALGGEWAGAVLLSVEHGDPLRRGRNASWAQMGPSLGTLLATGSIALITMLMSPDDFIAWGWRVPFFASVALVVFGLWIRVGVEETPLFKQIEQQRSKAQAPVSEVLREHWRSLLIGGGVRIGPDVLYSLSVAFSLSYMTTVLGLVAYAGSDGLVAGRRRQCIFHPAVWRSVGSLGPTRRVWSRRRARIVVDVRILPLAGDETTVADRARNRRRADDARDDVWAAGCVHR